MPEHALRQLADDAEHAVDLPEFAAIVHRAERRRRRRHALIGLGAAGAAAVVTTALVLPHDSENRSSPVTPPRPTQTATPGPSTHYLLHHPSALVRQPGALVASVSYASRDDAAALWQVCSVIQPDQSCPEVVTWTSDGWRTSRAAKIPDKLAIYDLPNGSVLVWLFNGGFVLDADGHRHHVTRSSRPVPAPPGGRYVNLPSGPQGEEPAGLLDTRTGVVHAPLAGPTTRCVYDDEWSGSTLWEYGASRCGVHPRTRVAWTSDLGHSWSTRTEKRPIVGIEVTPQRTAILLGGRTNELAAVDVTTDGGTSWHLTVLPKPIVAPDQYASTPGGPMFATVGADLYESDPTWTTFHRVGSMPIGTLGLATADGVVAAYGAESADIAASYDDGQSWRTVSPRPSS